MPIVIRRKDTLRGQLIILLVLSILAGIVGGTLVGLATGRNPSAQVHPGS